MNITKKAFKELEELSLYIKAGSPTFYHASQTSTVIPYDKLEASLSERGVENFTLGNLATLTPKMSLDSEHNLVVEGPVTWKDAREFCQSRSRQVITSPTEELASLLSGVATSCTGERCFGLGTIREQLVELEFLNFEGEIDLLRSDRALSEHSLFSSNEAKVLLKNYQKEYEDFSKFKNAPFPRMKTETDLMTGTEGQLGVITKATFKTIPAKKVNYIFIALEKWENDLSQHEVVFNAVQPFRSAIYACELIDENSWSYLDKGEIPREGKDIIFLEIDSEYFEEIYEKVLLKLTSLSEEDIFEVPESRCRELRMKIPRTIFEVNSKMGVTKKGTDVQSRPENFMDLLRFYKSMRIEGVDYNLFGHFGDAHLHFNFMPKPTSGDLEQCQSKLESLYEWVRAEKGSPFAEHGIGLIKQPFIKSFYNEIHLDLFSFLKERMDPHSHFFPEGFMLGCR
jgi:FAD/FMN-containing dehydrogenase